MQATVFGGQGILSEMPAALHLESGILGECRLSDGNDCFAARLDVFGKVGRVNQKAAPRSDRKAESSGF